MAPEILRNQGYTNKVDMFSMGSVFFNLLSGRYLFNGKNEAEILRKNALCKLYNMD